MRIIFGPWKRIKQKRGGKGIVMEFINFSPRNITRAIKSVRMNWAGHIARLKEKTIICRGGRKGRSCH
jgi:hypothetical protein